MNKIGNIIKQKRLKRALTLKELSNISNISISTLHKMESGNSKTINSVYIYRLSKILKFDYEKVLRNKWEIFPTFLYERKRCIDNK